MAECVESSFEVQNLGHPGCRESGQALGCNLLLVRDELVVLGSMRSREIHLRVDACGHAIQR